MSLASRIFSDASKSALVNGVPCRLSSPVATFAALLKKSSPSESGAVNIATSFSLIIPALGRATGLVATGVIVLVDCAFIALDLSVPSAGGASPVLAVIGLLASNLAFCSSRC